MIKIVNNDLSVLNDRLIQVLDFNATWCGPCRALKPVLERLENDYKCMPVNVEFADIDADDNEDLCDKFSVKNLPTIIVRCGDEEERLVGAVSQSVIEEAIHKFV